MRRAEPATAVCAGLSGASAIARFDQVTDVSDEERELAFANIKKAAEHYGVSSDVVPKRTRRMRGGEANG